MGNPAKSMKACLELHFEKERQRNVSSFLSR